VFHQLMGAVHIAGGLRRARLATGVSLALNGLLFAAWTPHIPLVKEGLGLSAGELGAALLGAPIGSVIAIVLGGRAVVRWGSRGVVLVTGVCYCVSAPLVAIGDNGIALFAALLFWGAAGGAQGVGMNSQTVAVEKAYGRPVIGGLQACWNLGALTGTGIGILLVHLGIGLFPQQLILLGAGLLAAGPTYANMLIDAPVARPTRSRRRPALLDKALVPLGLIALFDLLTEGAAADWAAVYLREEIGTNPTVAGIGYGAFAATMLVGRAASDRLTARFGSLTLIRTMSLTAAIAFAGALLSRHPVTVIAGFALLGAGLSVVLPELFRAGGNLPGYSAGEAVAAVSTYGWTGLLLGPPLIGLLAQFTNLSIGLALLCVGPLIVFALAPRVASFRH
jgi:MFS family permease